MTEPLNEPRLTCTTIADFEDDAANARWQVVNDNVMGGRSLGGRAFADHTMIFSGSINTDGGGFSSLRLPLADGVLHDEVLGDADRIVFRVRADHRNYKITFADSLEGRGRVSFNTPISFKTPGEWETATIFLADLIAVINGRPVESEPFRADLATRLGVIVSDGTDGEFSLEIDSISACRPEPVDPTGKRGRPARG